MRRPLRSTLFPYTTLFRSRERVEELHPPDARDADRAGLHDVDEHQLGLAERKPGQIPLQEEVDQQQDEERKHYGDDEDRKSTRLISSHLGISYAVFCLKQKSRSKPESPAHAPPPACPSPTD